MGTDLAKTEQDNVIAAASHLLKHSSYVFLKGTVSMIPNRNILFHFSILGEVISISIELLMKIDWFSQTKLNSVTKNPIQKPKLAVVS